MIGSFFVPHTTRSRMLLKGDEGGAKFGGTKINALKLLWLQLGCTKPKHEQATPVRIPNRPTRTGFSGQGLRHRGRRSRCSALDARAGQARRRPCAGRTRPRARRRVPVGDTYGPIGLAQSPSAQSSGIERPKHSPTSPSPLTGLRQFWPLALIWAYVDVPAGAMPSPCSGSPLGEIEVAVRTNSYSVTATTPGAGSGRHGAMKPAGRAREGKDMG